MKYKELQTIAKKNDYYIEKNEFRTILKKESLRGDYKNEIIISEIEIGVIDICMSLWFPWDFKLLEAVFDYTKTPLDERQEEKKFYLKHRWMKYAGNKDVEKYYNLHIETNLPYLGSKYQGEENQTQFTQKEIDEIKEEYDTTLDDFEQIEVEYGEI